MVAISHPVPVRRIGPVRTARHSLTLANPRPQKQPPVAADGNEVIDHVEAPIARRVIDAEKVAEHLVVEIRMVPEHGRRLDDAIWRDVYPEHPPLGLLLDLENGVRDRLPDQLDLAVSLGHSSPASLCR